MSTASGSLIDSLREVLLHLSRNPYPHVKNPPDCSKRASVAVIIRIRPPYQPDPDSLSTPDPGSASFAVIEPHIARTPLSNPFEIEKLFSQKWVQEGDAEILFIKRAGRVGDRWSGHIALPGGKRDPEDEDDRSAAIRETMEEIGLDLEVSNCLYVGNLPERVVTTTWGKNALMVLCPYVFIVADKTVVPLQPQPTEVAAIHWVPLRALLTSNVRTREYVDVSSRFARQGGPIVAKVLRILLGRMMFSAVRLIPSESLYASSIPGFVPESNIQSSIFSGLAQGAFGVPSSSVSSYQAPLLLWGLTLGVLADFLDMLPPHNAVRLWKYPTFTPPDLRILIYIFTRSLRRNNAGDLSSGTWPSQTAIDATAQATAVVSEGEPRYLANHDVGIGGLGVGSNPKHAVGKLLSGYYERMNIAIGVFLVYRTLLGSALIVWLYRYWQRRRRGAF